jgi:anti-sigma regulatory factor (Ser/Thr protein kinase)
VSAEDAVDIRTIKQALGAILIEGEDGLDGSVEHVYASDLMSDVLAFGKPHSVLLTGLATQQAVISAHMAEFRGVVFIRGKRIKDGSRKFAKEHRLVLMSTELDMYDACVRVEACRRGPCESAGENPGGDERGADVLLEHEYFIEGSDFGSAGMVSTEIKSVLKTIGFDPKLTRRVGISTYEGEMNVVMHARRAKVYLVITPSLVEVVIDDEGKGIPDVNLAMEKGFSTATEEQRALGFGAGMGLPNIRNNTDDMELTSEVGKGTKLKMRFYI